MIKIYSIYKLAKCSTKKLYLIVKSINKKQNIVDIIDNLFLINKKSSFLIGKTIKSALYNAINNYKLESNKLRLYNIIINKGPSRKKIFPRAKGRTDYIKKRTSHIKVILINI